MDDRRKIAFKTLGCRLNQFETDSIITQFHKAGYEIVDLKEKADVVIINTCTVTHQSDKKSKYEINRAISQNPDAVIIVAGCMVDNHKELLLKKANVTYVVDNKRKSSIFSLVESHFNGDILNPDSLPDDVFGFKAVEESQHTRTFLKIQDGCDNFCSYCIVPAVRGGAVSRKPTDIIDNLKKIIDVGFREVIITGVNISRYNYEGTGFEDLIRMILQVEGDFRVRISSLEPDAITSRFSDLFTHPKLTPHLHLCLQSGSDSILMKMRRMYTVKSFMDIIHSFRSIFPSFNFTTDIITGFPGETETDFSLSCKVAEEALFSHIHTFRYSKRAGTHASGMQDQIPEIVKAERSKVIQQISENNRNKYFKSLIGMDQKVLVEKNDEQGFAYGYGEHYVPVVFLEKNVEKNRFYTIKLGKVNEDKRIYGEIHNKGIEI